MYDDTIMSSLKTEKLMWQVLTSTANVSQLSCPENIFFLVFCVLWQIKYKENGIKSLPQSLYSQLPETAEMKFAKNVAELQSEVRNYWWGGGWGRASNSQIPGIRKKTWN